MVYIREAHAIDGPRPSFSVLVEDPITESERAEVARTCMTKMQLRPIPAVVDRLDDKVNKAYRGWPDRLFLVGRDGRIVYAGGRGPGGFRPNELAAAIKKELAQ